VRDGQSRRGQVRRVNQAPFDLVRGDVERRSPTLAGEALTERSLERSSVREQRAGFQGWVRGAPSMLPKRA